MWFERYVNFEFYKTVEGDDIPEGSFERHVNFEFYKTITKEISNLAGLRDM